MFPYFPEPQISFGNVTIIAFGFLVPFAVFVGCWILWLRLMTLRINKRTIAMMICSIIFVGFTSSHLCAIIFSQSKVVISHPKELLELWNNMSSYGGILGGLLCLFMIIKWLKLPKEIQLRIIDSTAFAFPFAWTFGRLGCAIAHDHLGIYTNHWLAVKFPTGSRLDMGLLEFLFTLLIIILFSFLNRCQWPPGFFSSLFFVLYGPVRFIMDEFRTGDPRYWGLTPAQYGSLVMTLIGFYLLINIVFQRNQQKVNSCKYR